MSIFNFIDRFFSVRDLELQLSIANAKIVDLTVENDQLKAKIKVLNDVIDDLHNDPVEFDEKSGTWIGVTLRYCANCKTKNIMSPLKSKKHEWYCPACDKKFDDPDNRPPPPYIPN